MSYLQQVLARYHKQLQMYVNSLVNMFDFVVQEDIKIGLMTAQHSANIINYNNK